MGRFGANLVEHAARGLEAAEEEEHRTQWEQVPGESSNPEAASGTETSCTA
jgi:hypothetical protein